MGNEQANETSISLTKQDREDWFKVEEQGFCELWANKKTGKRFQAYPIPDTIAKDKVQVEKYVFRKLHGSTLVSAEAIVSQNQAFLCSQPSSSFVLIENIVNRLRNFSRCFSFEEILYILASSSSGFNTLSSFFGPLEPNQDMICFNDEGKVKVWLNENLSRNEASINAKAYDSDLHKGEDYNVAQRRSKQCVDKLFRITQASASAPFPQDFREEIKNFSTFFQISNFVQFYSQQKGIRVPEKVQLKRQILSAVSAKSVQNTVIYSSRPSIQLSNLESSRVKQVFQPISSQKINFPPSYIVSQSRPLQAIPVTFTVGPPLQNHKVSITYPCSQTVIMPPVYTTVNQKIETVIVPQQTRIQEKHEPIAQAQSIATIVALVEQKPVEVPVEQVLIQNSSKVEQRQQIKEQPLLNVQEQMKKIYTFNEQHQILINYSKYEQTQQNQQVYHEAVANEVHSEPQVQQQVFQQPSWRQQPISESTYSQIQSYVPPVRQPEQHQVIDETKQEDYPSPKKESNQIDEWQERLNKFTNSQHIQQREQVFNISSRDVKEQAPQVHSEEPESFKNLKVTTQKEEYVNELADLESDDIEKYIRMKYQTYISEKSEPIQSNYKEQYHYEERERPPVKASARVELNSNSYSYEPQNEEYTSYYKPYEYRETSYKREEVTEKQNYPSDYRYDPKASYDNRVSIEQEFAQYSSRRNSGEYNYDKAKPLVEDQSYEYRQSNNLKSKKGSRNSQVIDEKYSKYVLNSQKPPKSPSFIKPLQEVSLILPQDESFINNRSYLAAPIYEKSNQASILSKNSERQGITYQKLRNLLWQE